MSQKLSIQVPMNRVEGDLEVHATIEQGVVTDARCSGTMFRGFERILVGRGALDGLVITPRICGICTTAHLTAAARALDQIGGATPPPHATRVRNVALMTELAQSDLRQTFLMFAADLVSPRYRDQPLHEEVARRFEPFRGDTVLQVLAHTKRLLEIVAIVGGQWPHSSFMVPGGVVSVPSSDDLLQCRLLLSQFRRWYEQRILGCSIERWSALSSHDELDAWLEQDSHHRSDLGLLLRFGRAIGLDRMGLGHPNLLSFGSLDLPEGTRLAGPDRSHQLVSAGFARDGRVEPFDPQSIAEDISHAWFEDGDSPLHPDRGQTEPYATGAEGRKYSWAKAPRYRGLPAETGPLAEMVVGGHPLYRDLLAARGASVLARQLARVARPALLLPAMECWLDEAIGAEGRYYDSPGRITDGQGCGLTHAARGALGHWVRIKDGQIDHYQIITPTAWNASPRDAAGARGPMEEALVGTPVGDEADPVELGHVVRSFDPCLVCTVHTLRRDGEAGRLSVGL